MPRVFYVLDFLFSGGTECCMFHLFRSVPVINWWFTQRTLKVMKFIQLM